MTDTLAKLTKISDEIAAILGSRDAAIKEIEAKFDDEAKKLNEARNQACESAKEAFVPQIEPLDDQMTKIQKSLSPVEKISYSIGGEKFRLIPLNTIVGAKSKARLYLLASDEKIGPGKAMLVSPDRHDYPFCCPVDIRFRYKFGGFYFILVTPTASCWLGSRYLDDQQLAQLTAELEEVMFEHHISTLVLYGEISNTASTIRSYEKKVRFRIEGSEDSRGAGYCGLDTNKNGLLVEAVSRR